MPLPPSLPAAIAHPARLAAVRRSGLLDGAPDAALDRLVGLAARLLQGSSAFITIVDDRTSHLKAITGEAQTGVDREHPVGESLCRHLIEVPAPVAIADARSDERTRATALVAGGVAAWASFPLLSPGGHVLGCFSVVDRAPRAWTDRDLDILGTLADAATAEIALVDALGEERAARDEVARALDRERRALRRAEALVAAGVALSEHNDAASVLQALVGVSVPHIGIWCAVHLKRRGMEPELVAVSHRVPELEARIRALGEGEASWLTQRIAGPVVLFHHPHTFLADDPEDPLAALGARQVVSLPLRVRGHTIGALTVGVDPDDQPDAATTVAALAGQAAVALDNAGLYDELAAVARILQQALLPGSLPDIPGVELAVRFRPAAVNVQVGGDFYDVFGTERRADRAFVVGDVAGKGPAAATLTGVVRHTLRAAFFRGDDPRQAVALANEALYGVADAEKFCTAIYGQMTVSEDHVRVDLVRAGHPAALVIRAGGAVDVIEPLGVVIGYQLDAAWEASRVELGPGDALLLYTDGAIEFPRRRDLDGEQELHELALRLCEASAQEIVEAVEHHAVVLSDGPLRDDLALLVIRCCPPAAADAPAAIDP